MTMFMHLESPRQTECYKELTNRGRMDHNGMKKWLKTMDMSESTYPRKTFPPQRDREVESTKKPTAHF